MSTMTLIEKEKLLAGIPIPLSDDTCLVYPITLREIATIGSQTFYRYLNLMSLTDSEVKSLFKDDKATPFAFILVQSAISKEFLTEILNALSFFTKQQITFMPQIQSFMIGDMDNMKFLTQDNFFEFQNIIRQQNCLSAEKQVTKVNPIVDRIKEKIRKGKEQIDKIKKKEESDLEFADLIGSVPIYGIGLNIINIWDVSYYAFNDQFRRIRAHQEYTTSLQSIMAGADPKKVKLKDWIQNIQLNKTN